MGGIRVLNVKGFKKTDFPMQKHCAWSVPRLAGQKPPYLVFRMNTSPSWTLARRSTQGGRPLRDA